MAQGQRSGVWLAGVWRSGLSSHCPATVIRTVYDTLPLDTLIVSLCLYDESLDSHHSSESCVPIANETGFTAHIKLIEHPHHS